MQYREGRPGESSANRKVHFVNGHSFPSLYRASCNTLNILIYLQNAKILTTASVFRELFPDLRCRIA